MVKEEMATNLAEAFVDRLIPEEELYPKRRDQVPALPSFLSKIRAYERHFGARFSQLDHDLQEALVLRRLRQMTNTLRLNPLWKERLEQAGLSAAPRDFEEWQQVPISDRATVEDLFLGPRLGLVVPLTRGGFQVLASGGTGGGRRVETVYARRELLDTYRIVGEFMGHYVYDGFLPAGEPRWVMTTLADFQMWSTGTLVGGVLQAVPGVSFLGAGPVRKEVFQHLLSYRGPKAVLALSHGIAFLPDLGAGSSDEARTSLRLAQSAGAHLPYRSELELKERYPKLEVLSYFTTTQAEAVGLQLSRDGHLVAVPGLHLVEIVDDDGRWVAEGEEGELVVTRLHAHEAPLPRLKLGDRVIRRSRVEDNALQAEQFEFVGRSADVIRLQGAEYFAPRVYSHLCRGLMAAGALDLTAAAHEVQFEYPRHPGSLRLVAAVDAAETLAARVRVAIGTEGVHGVFVDALTRSISASSVQQDPVRALDSSSCSLELRLVPRWSESIFRTDLGRVPLIRSSA